MANFSWWSDAVLTVSPPGFQPAGQTSPWVSVYWNACTSRKVSSTERPTGKSFMVIWRSTYRVTACLPASRADLSMGVCVLECLYQSQSSQPSDLMVNRSWWSDAVPTVSPPGFQPAGQTSPWVSVYWNACTSRKVSSTERPTGKSFMVIWRSTPLGSMMNKPLQRYISST